jgi:hypothetical protein
MGPFQKIVILLFVILLILILVIVGFTVSNTKNKTWPPIVGDCPDYWLDTKGDGSNCVNMKDLGTCNGSVTSGNHLTMDFTQQQFSTVCNKYKWANNCGLTWDGITNLSSDPCNS